MKLRSYQQECIDNCIAWIKQSIEPAVVDATVSFGKSMTIVTLADMIVKMSGKKVLITCPDGNLVKQNADEAKGLGIKVSIFSASLKSKSTKHPIVIGTPKTIANYLESFGKDFACMLVDEGDGLTKSIIAIYNQLKSTNPNARCIGFTGTPWKTKTGYVYKLDLHGNPVPETQTKDPFYAKLIHRTSTQDLLDLGYLTPVLVGASNVEPYMTRHLSTKSSNSDVDRAYLGQNRKTAAIVADIIENSRHTEGVMIFGATKKHCLEIMASLPPSLSRMVADGMPNNKQTFKDFAEMKFRYLVNVDMATVGANFPHVGVIAVMRKTYSSRLLTQIIGRGIRLHKGNWPRDDEPSTPELRKEAIAKGPKPFCLYLDYTEDNIPTHFPDGDLWNPVISANITGKSGGEIECTCPECGIKNVFGARKNNDGYESDKNGYWIDLAGSRIETEYGPTPSHYGRRCMAMTLQKGVYKQCEYRWSSKKCPACDADNDIAARYCCACDLELVDPNQALVLAQQAFDAKKRDASQPQTDRLVAWAVKKSVSTTGKEMHVVSWKTEHRTFETCTIAKPTSQFQYYGLEKLMDGTKKLTEMPKTISYKRPKGQKFFEILGFNREVEDRP